MDNKKGIFERIASLFSRKEEKNVIEYTALSGLKLVYDEESESVYTSGLDSEGKVQVFKLVGDLKFNLGENKSLIVKEGKFSEIVEEALEEETVQEEVQENVEEENVEQKFVEYITEGGTKLFVDEQDSRVFVVEVNEEGEEEFIPFEGDAEIPLADGRVLVVVDGFVTEIRGEIVEEEEEMTVEELTSKDGKTYILNTTNNEVFTKEEGAEPVRVQDTLTVELEDGRIMVIEEGLFVKFLTEQDVQMSKMAKELEEFKSLVVELQEKVAKLSKEPAGEKIKTNNHSTTSFSSKKQSKRDIAMELNQRLNRKK